LCHLSHAFFLIFFFFFAVAFPAIATIIDGDVDALTFTSWWYEGSTKRSLRLTHSIHNETFTVTFEDAATGGLATSGLSNAGSAPGDDSADKRVRPAPLAVGQVMSKHGKVTYVADVLSTCVTILVHLMPFWLRRSLLILE
jgi:hypothetical protein